MMQMYSSSYTTPLDGSSLMRAITGHSSKKRDLEVPFSDSFPAGRRFRWPSSPFSSLAAAKSFRPEVARQLELERDEGFKSLQQVKRAWSRQIHDAEAVAKQPSDASFHTSVRLNSLLAAASRDGCLLSLYTNSCCRL